MDKKYTFEEFKEAAAKEIMKIRFMQYDAKKAGIPLEKWCKAYVEYMAEHDESNIVQRFLEYMAEHDESNIVQRFYKPYLDGSHAFEYQVQILANTWFWEEERIPLKKLSKYL